MEKRREKNFAIIAVAVTLAVVVILVVTGFAAGNREYKPSNWVIKTYGNNVALFNGDKVDTVYGEIVLENLPEEDIKMLEAGIAFPTKDEAEQAIEDYDG